jgi:hypothetical protein
MTVRTAWRDCSRHVLVLQLLCRWGMIRGNRWKITGQNWISISWPCTATLKQTDCVMCSDFYVLVTIKMNMTRHGNYDWLENESSDKLSDLYAKYYSLTDHLAVDEIVVLFKDRVIFKQVIPKKHTQFGTKLYKSCDSKLHTYNMTVCAGKDRKCVTPSITATRDCNWTYCKDWKCGTQGAHG